MLADKQQLAGQMMRSDEHLASVKLQYEVSIAACYSECHQCFDTVGWASGRASGL